MDPVTQGALGAAVTVGVMHRRLGRRAWWLGALGGMAADLDVLIRSPGDPLLGLEYHRHFTHSLAFIPVGGLIAALPWLLRRTEPDRLGVLLATTVGYATHALLDAFTSYGTLLWWPFSDQRVAWNWISIVDPLFTVPLLVGVWLSRRRDHRRPAVVALAMAAFYMSLCGVQRWRVLTAQDRIIASRGHTAERREVFPLFLNNVRWRALYVHDGRLWADAIHASWFGQPSVYVPGTSEPLVEEDDLPPSVLADATTRAGVRLFKWFASDRLMLEPAPAPGTTRVCDTRYSMVPEGFRPMFCLDLTPGAEEAIKRPSLRRADGGSVAKYVPGLAEDETRAIP